MMRRAALAAIVLAAVASGAEAQRGRRGPQFRIRTPADSPYDGAFRFCRIMFRNRPTATAPAGASTIRAPTRT